MYDISYDNWINLADDKKFEHVKDIMKRAGIYYRLNNSPSNKKEWVLPIFETES